MGYLLVALSAVSYACGIVAQTVAARRTPPAGRLEVGLATRLISDPVYLAGFGAQVGGFVLAFLARAELPLYLVQAVGTSAVGLAAIGGAIAFGWRVGRAEMAALALLVLGLVLLVGAAEPSVARDLPGWAGWALLGLLVVVIGVARLAVAVPGARGAVLLGVLAGVAFAVLAIASRPLASGSLLALPFEPLAWLMIAGALTGQFLLATALQRGAPTATSASMDAAAVVLASAAGLALLGDQITDGRVAWVAGGLALVLLGVVAMAVAARTPARHDGVALVPDIEGEQVSRP